eukprot:1147363-Pelagomonas_calceolata.AAC.1
MNSRDNDIHLIELKFCSDTKPEQTLLNAQNQHKNTTENLRKKSSEVHTAITESLYVLSPLELLELSTTPTQSIPICNLGLTKEKAHKIATKLHLHAAKTLTKIDNTKHAIHFNNSSNGGSGEGVVERAACRRARRTPGRMADSPPDPH